MKFEVIEDVKTFNMDNFLQLTSDNSIAGYVLRNYLEDTTCDLLRNEFFKIIEESNGGNRAKDFVPVLQIGATQFTKSTEKYFEECRTIKPLIDRIIDAGSKDSKTDFLLEDALTCEFQKRNVNFRPSKYNHENVNQFTIRQWTNETTNGYSLLPHEDLSQLELAKLDNYEISKIDKVLACNLCVSNTGNAELVVWNMEPTLDVKVGLGIEQSGYPYPFELLHDVPNVKIDLRKGDICFINANLIHAVTDIGNAERITLGRFLGFSNKDNFIYWT